MATDPPPPAPEPPPTPAPLPGPNASRGWRRQQWSQGGPRNWFGSGWFWGAVLVVLGIYFLLSNLKLLGWLRGDVFWPIVLILFGVFLIVRRARWWP